MKSRAQMLLEKEYVKLQRENFWGIKAYPINEDNIFLWEAKINGLKETMWEGGIFKIYLEFSDSYNMTPPKVFFATIPYHPNVHSSTGVPCLDFLDNLADWMPNYSISYILLSIQILLSNPVLQDAVNEEAAYEYYHNRKAYNETVINCILESKRMDGNLKRSSVIKNNSEIVEEEKNDDIHFHLKKISFEDYLKLWKGIATSKLSTTPQNAMREYLGNNDKLQEAHFDLSQHEVENEIHFQLTQHRRLMYGTFASKNDNLSEINSSPRSVSTKSYFLRHFYEGKPNSTDTEHLNDTADRKDFEIEATDLVTWSRNLSAD